MSSDTKPDVTGEPPELLEARSHELRAESELLLAQAKRLRLTLNAASQAPALVDRKTLCVELGISPATLGRLMRADKEFPIEYAGTYPRFSIPDVRARLAEKRKFVTPARRPKAPESPGDIELDDGLLSAAGLRRTES